MLRISSFLSFLESRFSSSPMVLSVQKVFLCPAHLIIFAILLAILIPIELYSQEEEPTEIPDLEVVLPETSEELSEYLLELTSQRPFDLFKNVDILLSFTTGLSARFTDNEAVLREELATQVPNPSAAPAGDSFSYITETLALPFFIGGELHAYYKKYGGGISYYHINQYTGSLTTGVPTPEVDDADSDDSTNSFSNFAHSTRYEYSLVSDAFAFEFHFRQDIRTKRVHIALGLGYLYQFGTFQVNVIPIDDQDTLSMRNTQTSVTSHGIIARVEMQFLLRFILIRTGILLVSQSFPQLEIAGVDLSPPDLLIAPYISFGLSF